MHWVKSANSRKRVDESFFGSVLRYSPSAYHRRKISQIKLNMALENLKHISLICGYLLENHIRKSDDFSFDLDEFWIFRISKSIAF